MLPAWTVFSNSSNLDTEKKWKSEKAERGGEKEDFSYLDNRIIILLKEEEFVKEELENSEEWPVAA